MPPFAALLIVAATAAGIYAAAGGTFALSRVLLHPGETRRVRFSDGSSPEHESRLRALFGPGVHDEGGGIYAVTAESEGLFSLPAGSALVGGVASPITLYAAFYKGRHVGFAFGEEAARAIRGAYFPLTFKRSSQAYPQTWNKVWMPVYGDGLGRTVWGRFLRPYDETVASYMRGEGLYARAEPDPNLKRPDEWFALAQR